MEILCELQQEFSFAHPKSRFKANLIFNSHFTGSPLWDLFSDEARKLENSWNVSVRKTFDLPLQTHRYLIEPVSEHIHLKKLLLRRFISFLQQIMKSNKMVPKMLLKCVKNDTRSITGANIRKLLILTKKDNIDSISAKDIDDIEYEEIFNEDLWRVNVIKELTDVKFGQLNIEGFSDDEFKEILHYACTS